MSDGEDSDAPSDDSADDQDESLKRRAARRRRRRRRPKRPHRMRRRADSGDDAAHRDDGGEAAAAAAAASGLTYHRRLALSATITIIGIAVVALRDSDIGAVVVVVGLLMLMWSIHRFGRLGVEST